MPEEKLRVPGSSYEELIKIVKAYGTMNSPASPNDVGDIAGMHSTIVSRNNAFLVGIGVVEGGNKKVATSKGKALASALEHDMSEQIRKSWHEIVMSSDFLQKILAAVKVRKGMEESTLQSHVAYSAGQPRTPTVMAGAGAVVEILKVASLLKDEDGKLVTVADSTAPIYDKPQPAGPVDVGWPTPPGKKPAAPIDAARVVREGVAISIQIQLQCSVQEIESLAPKLRALLEEIAKPEGPQTTKADE